MNNAEDTIIARVMAGDTEAYSEIMDLYQKQLWAIAAYYIFDRSSIDDLVQQALVKAYFALESFKPGTDFGAWLRTIMRNEVRMALRKLASDDNRKTGFIERKTAEAGLTELENDYTERRQQFLEDCILSIPEHSRELLDARYQDAQSIQQIAEKTAKSIDAIKKALSRVRQSLRECIESKELAYNGG